MFDGTPKLLAAEAPVLIFGGCYSNIEATRALLAEAARRAIPPTRMICTGDIVAYGADPRACADLIRAEGIATVMGNCEEQLAADAADCGCGFPSGSACDRLSAAWFAHAGAELAPAHRAWMASLPRRLDLLIAGFRLAIFHAAPSRINRFLFASDPDALFAEELDAAGADGVIAGHCGLPFTRMIGHRLWHNTGAIGLPANDGTSQGWFSILTPEAGRLRITTHRLAYDHAAAAGAMRRARLPEEYADAVETGIWPSFDILPLAEQAATAAPLPEQSFTWPGTPPPAPAPEPQPAQVALESLETLWFNTGTLCNIACEGCYIESSSRNDRLAYLGYAEFSRLLNEAAAHPALREIGFTGGEPFLNKDTPAMIEAALARGYRALVLTNAMRPMRRHEATLRRLRAEHGPRLALRVSLDHFTARGHERIRGPGTWKPALAGLRWLTEQGFTPAIAARFDAAQTNEASLRAGFAALFAAEALPIDAADPLALLLFPEMTAAAPVGHVPEPAWRAMRRRGRDAMCRTSRMVVQRKGAARASIAACTLLPYETRFDLGPTLAAASRPVALDHPHCAQFCVFGAASCSR